MKISKHKMVSRLLTTAIVLKNVCSINSQSEGWNKISRLFGENGEKTKTTRHKSTKSYMSNPLMLTTEITESKFPDVTYPTSILDAREPFYFGSSGYDDVLRPFSDDVKMSYNALKADKRKKSALSNYHSSSKPVVDAQKINTQDLESNKIYLNDKSMNNERVLNDGTLGIDREEKDTKSYTSDSEVQAYLNLTDACTDSKDNEITVMALKNSTLNFNFELPSNGVILDTKERNKTEHNVLFDRKNIVPNWNERDFNIKGVITNENEYNYNVDENQFVSKEIKIVSNNSQSDIYKSLDDKKHLRELSYSSKYKETPAELLSTLYDTKKSFDSMLNRIENMLEPVKTLSNITNERNLIDENSMNELQIGKNSDINGLVNKTSDIENKENHTSNIDELPKFTKNMNDDCNEVMNNINKSPTNSLVEILGNQNNSDTPYGLSIILTLENDIKGEKNEENITGLFPNYYVQENLKSTKDDKLIEHNTSHEYIKDFPVFDGSYDLSFELDIITADKSALTFETISEEDISIETNVKSAANSLSIFDSFKTTNNPFNFFFHSQTHDS